MRRIAFIIGCLLISFLSSTAAFSQLTRTASGIVVDPQFQRIPNAKISIVGEDGSEIATATTDSEGYFRADVPGEPLTISVVGRNFNENALKISAVAAADRLVLKVSYRIAPIAENVTIEGDSLSPEIEYRNDVIYRNSLFTRDDQIIFTLNAGINAGQHEGGGKSLEIRRFGFNTDHGGVNGGLKIMVDNFQQNQDTQGHGQGYLGNLKSLSPELVQDVSIINGPFSAVYGDFSGLGVVQIRQKEELPDLFTVRLQGGAFNTFRGFFAYSPKWGATEGFVAYEPSYTDGPFDHPLKYRRDNVSGNFTYRSSEQRALGVKFNFGRNNFYSSGQIPLDEVIEGRLDRFGAIDPENGGKVKLGTVGVFFRHEADSGATFRADAYLNRTLFDLFSNFTFFLADPIYGDEIQQHDSRLQQTANVQYILPYKWGRDSSVLTVGGGMLLNQINVGLYPSASRDPNRKFFPENIDNPNVLLTKANAKVNNFSGYVQNSLDLLDGHLHIEAGLRFDSFVYNVDGFELGGIETGPEQKPGSACNSSFADPVNRANPCALILDGRESAGRFQPKLAVALTPFERVPISFYVNYGRGISSQDARGVIRDPSGPKIATTDFYQFGTSYNGRRISAVFTSFLIDRSNEQVYIPDDGTIEFAGRSRSFGLEFRNAVRLRRHLSFNAGLTQVIKAYYPGEFTGDGKRIVVDSAPHTVANAGVVIGEIRGFNAFVNWRHISNYRLDGEDPTIRAAGNDVVDVSMTKRLKRWLDLNFSIDNLLNKRYYETQNYFESRVLPGSGSPVGERIHATPGYPITISAGLTFRFGSKR